MKITVFISFFFLLLVNNQLTWWDCHRCPVSPGVLRRRRKSEVVKMEKTSKSTQVCRRTRLGCLWDTGVNSAFPPLYHLTLSVKKKDLSLLINQSQMTLLFSFPFLMITLSMFVSYLYNPVIRWWSETHNSGMPRLQWDEMWWWKACQHGKVHGEGKIPKVISFKHDL